MPSKPKRKARNIDAVVDQFAQLATRFDELLPERYRFDGKTPSKDARANAWALVDQRMILTAEALTRLQAILRRYANGQAYYKPEPEEVAVGES